MPQIASLAPRPRRLRGPVLLLAAVSCLASSAALAAPPYATFSTYLGGTGIGDNGEFWRESTIASVVLDSDGNVIVCGDTNTTDIAANVVHDHRSGTPGSTRRDIYVAKLDPIGSQLLWIAFLGGANDDDRAALALGSDGSLYVGGRTNSALTATPGAYQASGSGFYDAFLARLTADGSSVTHLTYLGGAGNDSPADLRVGADGKIYVVGTTEYAAGTAFPSTPGTIQPARGGTSSDAFVARLTFGAGGASSLDWSTYFGGTGLEQGLNLGVTPAGALVITGFTASIDFQTKFPVRPSLGGAGDFFVARLSSDGGTLVFSTYLGGSNDEGGAGSSAQAEAPLAVLNEEEVIVSGLTNSADFPTENAAQPTPGSSIDAFATRLRWSGAALSYVYSTYIGFGGAEGAFAVAVDPSGNAIVTGARQNATATMQDAFITKLSPAGAILWDTTYGGSGSDVALGLAIDAFGDLYLTGQTLSSNLPTISLGVPGSAYDTALGGTRDAFVVRISEADPPTITATTPTTAPATGGTSVTIGGTNFRLGATVTIGGVAATGVVVQNATTITVIAPPGPSGTAAVVVTNPNGQIATYATGFAYDSDGDGDGLSDLWEIQYGLNPASAVGDDGANGDPDKDGATNQKEFADGTPPNAAEVRYFAEGATITPFTTRLALLNADDTRTATVQLQFLLGGSRQGEVVTRSETIAPHARKTIVPSVDYIADLAAAEFSTVIRSNLSLAADRLMTWNSAPFGTGSHAETGILAPAEEWFLAEGATIGSFELYYLIQNPNDTDIDVEVTYLKPSGPLPARSYPVAKNSRFNIYVNGESGLNNAELSATLRSPAGKPIIVERAMYLRTPTGIFGAGHESAGITQQAKTWFFAEGATGAFFDLFILVANPGSQPATVTATFLSTSGQTCSKIYPVAARSRYNIWVDAESIPGCPIDFADAALSTTLSSDVDIVAERAMWWSSTPDASAWYEAHNSPGSTASGTLWSLAEGEVGNVDQAETYVLIANASAYAGLARVTLLFEDGTTTSRDYPLNPNSRTNVPVGATTADGGFGLAVQGRRFGATVESLTASGQSQPAQIVVERALYSTPPGTAFWSAGTNALAARVR